MLSNRCQQAATADSVSPMAAIDIDVVGDEVTDRTPSGLWPADHAGVVAILELGQP